MASELWQRIRAVRRHMDLTQEGFAELFGVSKAAVSQWEAAAEKQRTRPDLIRLQQISEKSGAPLNWLASDGSDVDEQWWLEEERPMFSRSTSIPAFSRASEPPAAYSTMQPIRAWEHADELPEGEFVMVPRLEVHLAASNGAQHGSQVEIEFNERQPQAFRAEWVRQQHLKPNKLAAMTAKGNSMEPTIHDGDSLLVDTSQLEVIDGKVYALWYEGGERVKRLYRMPGGGLRIRSDNYGEHPEIVLGSEYAEHVRVIGRVVHRSGTGGL